MCSVYGMSGGPVIEESFAHLFIHDSIFDDKALAASLDRVTSMKDLRAVSRHCVYRTNSDDDESTYDEDSNKALEKSLSESGILLKKRLIRSGILSPFRRQKSVTFADMKGKDLVQVREFYNNLEPIQNCLSDNIGCNRNVSYPKFITMFCQPCANYSDFMRQLYTQKVCLENAQIISENVLIGTIKVQNVSFEKHVTIRYTVDEWKTQRDLQAKFLHSESVETDIFTFRMNIPQGVKSFIFCIRFWCNGSEYWDNNNGCNYRIRARVASDDGGQIK